MAGDSWQDLGGILGGLVKSTVWSQARNDLAYRSNLETFRALLQQARDSGLEAVAQQFLPVRQVHQETELQLEIAIRSAAGGGIVGMLVNSTYARRYAHAQTSRQRISMTVRSIPPSPGRSTFK